MLFLHKINTVSVVLYLKEKKMLILTDDFGDLFKQIQVAVQSVPN